MTTLQQKLFIRKNALDMPIKTIAREIGRSTSFVKYEIKRQEIALPKKIIDQGHIKKI